MGFAAVPMAAVLCFFTVIAANAERPQLAG